jgi:putative salt-induced outer membrane protein YdiY
MKASITPGIGLSYSEIEEENSVGDFIATVVQDFSFDISDTVKFTEEVTVLYSPSENGDYVYSFQAGIENRITKSLSLNLLYDYTYDQRVSDENDRTEELISLSLGARF